METRDHKQDSWAILEPPRHWSCLCLTIVLWFMTVSIKKIIARTDAHGRSTQFSMRQVMAWIATRPSASLKIVSISHRHGFLLLSHDLTVKNLEDTNQPNEAGWQHTRVSILISQFGRKHALFSVKHTLPGPSEVYYVLPTLHLCHLGRIIQAN